MLHLNCWWPLLISAYLAPPDGAWLDIKPVSDMVWVLLFKCSRCDKSQKICTPPVQSQFVFLTRKQLASMFTAEFCTTAPTWRMCSGQPTPLVQSVSLIGQSQVRAHSDLSPQFTIRSGVGQRRRFLPFIFNFVVGRVITAVLFLCKNCGINICLDEKLSDSEGADNV